MTKPPKTPQPNPQREDAETAKEATRHAERTENPAESGAPGGTAREAAATERDVSDKPKEDPSRTKAEKPPRQEADHSGNGESKGDAPEEIGGPKGPEPTRFGDWERGGRCSDF